MQDTTLPSKPNRLLVTEMYPFTARLPYKTNFMGSLKGILKAKMSKALIPFRPGEQKFKKPEQ